MSLIVRSPYAPGCDSPATRDTLGSASLSSCIRLAVSSGARKVKPVTFPPGCARDATSPSSIAHHRCNNRNSGGCLPGGKGGRRIRREDQVNLETNQLRCEIWEPLDPRVRASVLDGDVSTLRIAELTQPLPEGVELYSRLGGFQRTGYHQTNPWDFRRWLGIHAQRPRCRRAAEKRDEFATLQLIEWHSAP